MRGLVLMLTVLAGLLAQVGGANGSETYREWLTFNEVRLDGKKRTVLSRHAVFPEIYSFSPDRRRLAYAPYVYDGARSKELWIANVRRPGERLALRASGWITDVSWAPAGETIALSIAAPAEGVWLVQADGTGLRKIADIGFGLSWSPDSRQLLYHRYLGLRLHMALLDLESGSARELGEGQQPEWSRNGAEIVYERVLGCDCLPEIRVLSIATGESRKLVRGLSPTWSPDGSRIAYTHSFRGRPDSLWVIGRTGANRRLLASRARSGVWSPNGRWIAFIRLAQVQGPELCRTQLIVASTRDGRTRRIATETRYITPQAWTRRGLLYSALRCMA